MFKIKRLFFFIVLAGFVSETSYSQMVTNKRIGDLNVVKSVVPFLKIAPDSRAGTMGDVGAATSPDVNSMHWNPAKYAFIENDMGLAISYTPWLRNLIGDINLAYISGYKRIDRKQVVAASLLYFSLGNIIFTDIFGNNMGQFNPNEFAIDVAYSRAFSGKFSGGLAFRYIYSNLTGGAYVGSVQSKAGQSFAADVSTYFVDNIEFFEKDGKLAFGINISNIGTKLSYTENDNKEFIPINIRFGGAISIDLDGYNSITLTCDMNKLLVPTPPIYYTDSVDSNNELVIQYGKDPNVSVPIGMFRSFFDAPGVIDGKSGRYVLKEELREITYSFGMEYWYNEQFAIRGGYFHEHESKGNRKFFSVGVGLKLNVFGIDFGYLIPVHQNNPLANTIRFTLAFDFDGFKKLNTTEP